VVKRRDALYHKEGFSLEEPPRDVPHLLVLDFSSNGGITPHPDAGSVIAAEITFALAQYGRQVPVNLRDRLQVQGMRHDGENLEKTLHVVDTLAGENKIPPVHYILYGSYREGTDYISCDVKLLDVQRGMVIAQRSLSELKKQGLLRLCQRTARWVYETIPYQGRVLKSKDDSVLVNLGSYDGLKKGDRLMVEKYHNSDNSAGLKKKYIFTIEDIDTLLCRARPEKKDDLLEIAPSDRVVPVQKRRARKIR
jgi:hypothetical protein